MADQLSSLKIRLATAVRATKAAIRRHAFWFAVPAATLGVVAVAGVVGSSALLRADEWQTRSGELRATREAARVWRQELIASSPEEEEAWRASAAAVRERGIDPGDRLALLQQVAQRAEDLGIGDVEVSFERSSALETSAIREVGEAVFEVAPWALSARFTADYRTVGSFIGSLPPQVDVHRLRMAALETAVETELVLIVFAGEDG